MARLVQCICFFMLAAILLAGCAGASIETALFSPPTSSTSPPTEITVAAAADLQFAFAEIAALFEEETSYQVVLVFGSTGQLVQQIENGAPFDLIAAANMAYIDRLVDQKLVLPESVALYAQGRIVLAVNRASGVEATSLQDLRASNIRHVAIANPEHAPYGLAAKQALQSVGVWDQIQEKLVLAENVRQALQYIQTGDAEAGIISLSVANVPEVSWTLIDGSLYDPLNQALAVLAASQHPELAAQFSAYINGERGRPVMRRYGFILPGEVALLVPTATPEWTDSP